jgi:two-component system capsular synthesis response regulator RcsB
VSGHASFDVLVMGFEMAGSGAAQGLDALAEVRASRPDAAIVVLTVSVDAQVLNAALARGAVAVISKRDRVELIHVALVAAHARERYLGPRIRDALYEGMPGSPAEQWRARLTRREFEVLRLYASGHAISDIARQTERSVKTISAQKCRAMRKLNLSSDADVYRFALTSGMISSVPRGSET